MPVKQKKKNRRADIKTTEDKSPEECMVGRSDEQKTIKSEVHNRRSQKNNSNMSENQKTKKLMIPESKQSRIRTTRNPKIQNIR